MLLTRTLLLCSALAVSTCGTIYTTPKVIATSEHVTVVDVTAQIVAAANRDAYNPQQLPQVFSHLSNSASLNTGLNTGLNRLAGTPVAAKRGLHLPPKVTPGPYRLGVSDVVLLATPTPQTTDALTGLIAAQNKRQGYTIQDDGAIAVPDIGRINLAGKTIEEAEAEIFQALVDNQIDPKFSLEISDFNSQNVSISGAVKTAKTTPITLKPLTLQDALQSAGGIQSDTPAFTMIRIFRGGKRYQIPMQELSARPTLLKMVLQAGDSLLVENDFAKQLALINAKTQAFEVAKTKIQLRQVRSNEARQNFITRLELGAVKRDYAYMAGEVAKQGRFALPFDNTASVADALYSEGGVKTREGDLGQIYILRSHPNQTKITAYHLDASNVINLLLATKMQLRPNDIIFVAEQRVTAWDRVISQIAPTVTVIKQIEGEY